MIYALLEWVALVLILGATLFVVIGIYRTTSPSPDREEERRQMREERRRPGRNQ